MGVVAVELRAYVGNRGVLTEEECSKTEKGRQRAWKTPTEMREISARNGKEQIEVEERAMTELGRSKGRRVSIRRQ